MIKYDPTLLHLDYLSGGNWHPLVISNLNYQNTYNPDDGYTLIPGSETITFTLNGPGPKSLVQVLRDLRLQYDGHLVGSGYFTVDSYRRVYTPITGGWRTDATCTAVGAYAAALSISVTYKTVRPAHETAIQFIRQWVKVNNF